MLDSDVEYAAQRGNVELVLTYFAEGGDISGEMGYSTLNKAARFGRTILVERLLDLGANPNGFPYQHYNSHMHAAARMGKVDAMNILLKRGAEIDILTEGDETPLMAAANQGQVEAVTFLVSNGANIQRVDSLGKSALDYACEGLANFEKLRPQYIKGETIHRFMDKVSSFNQIINLLDNLNN